MAGPLISLDTSGTFALLNAADPHHRRTAAALLDDPGPYLVPAGILAEIADLVEYRLGHDTLDRFLADLESGAFTLDCGEGDLGRVRQLVDRYAGLPLGFADASVIACAERSGGRVLTLDRRDFDVLAGEIPLEVLPG